jgi:hypothetical protein
VRFLLSHVQGSLGFKTRTTNSLRLWALRIRMRHTSPAGLSGPRSAFRPRRVRVRPQSVPGPLFRAIPYSLRQCRIGFKIGLKSPTRVHDEAKFEWYARHSGARAFAHEPGIHRPSPCHLCADRNHTADGYGLRACRCAAPRNDGTGWLDDRFT